MSDTWNAIQEMKSKQSSLRAKILERKRLREDIEAEIANVDAGVKSASSHSPGSGSRPSSRSPSPAPPSGPNSSPSSSSAVPSSVTASPQKLPVSSLAKPSNPDIEKKLVQVFLDISLTIPCSAESLTRRTSKLLRQKVELPVIEDLLHKFAAQQLISVITKDSVDVKCEVIVTFVDIPKFAAVSHDVSASSSKTDADSAKRKRDRSSSGKVKKPRFLYSAEALTAALASIADGIAIRKAARIYQIPESTLRHRRLSPVTNINGLGRSLYFSADVEETLAQHCIKMADIGYRYSRMQIITFAGNIIDSVKPSKNWFYRFLQRYPNVKSIKRQHPLSSKSESIQTPSLVTYYSEFESVLTEHGLRDCADRIWIVDETIINIDKQSVNVFSGTQVPKLTPSVGKLHQTLVLSTGSASGESLPPYVVSKVKRQSSKFVNTDTCIPGTKYVVCSDTVSESSIFSGYFHQHFLTCVTERPCILLYDGHSRYVTSAIIKAARQHNVHIFPIPPNTSSAVLPQSKCDLGFCLFRTQFSTECSDFEQLHQGKVITRRRLPAVISTSYVKALTRTNLMALFCLSAIVPFDPAKGINNLTDLPTSPSSLESSDDSSGDQVYSDDSFSDSDSDSDT